MFPYTEVVVVPKVDGRTDWKVALEQVAERYAVPMRLEVLTPLLDMGGSTEIRILVLGVAEEEGCTKEHLDFDGYCDRDGCVNWGHTL